jgi:hypothetical protein
MNKNIKLTPSQQADINLLLKQSKFDRLVKGLLAETKIDRDTKAKLILQLKKKLFDESPKRRSRFN